jgi:hypothetical protein
MIKNALAASLAAAILTAACAQAQEVGDYDFGLGVSSVGLTGEIRYRATERMRYTAMISGAPNYRKKEEAGDIIYDAIAEIRGLSLLADYRIGRTNFHVIGGAFISGNKVLGRASGNLLIGDTVYNTSVEADVRFANRVSPILALGYEQSIGDRWNLNISGGYIYTNGIEAGISVVGGNPVDPDDLIEEAEQIESEIGDGYPFITLGLTFRF